MKKIKYDNFDFTYKIKNEFEFLDLQILLVQKEKKQTFDIIEKSSWIWILFDIKKDKTTDLELLKQKVFNYLDIRIFLDWIEKVHEQIEKHKYRAWDYKIF